MWKVLGMEDTFPVFCGLLMVSGVLSYCLSVYQIFLGLKEDKVVSGNDHEAGVEAESIDVWTTKEQEDVTVVVVELGECSTKNARVWPKMGSERNKKKRRTNATSPSEESNELKGLWASKYLSCPVEVGKDPMEGSSAKRIPGKVKSGRRQERVSEINDKMEIPGLVLEKPENKELGAKNNQIRKKGKVTFLGYNYRDSFPTSVRPTEARRVDDASPEVACSRKWQVTKTSQPSATLPEPTGSTWQLLGNKWVEIKIKKNP